MLRTESLTVQIVRSIPGMCSPAAHGLSCGKLGLSGVNSLSDQIEFLIQIYCILKTFHYSWHLAIVQRVDGDKMKTLGMRYKKCHLVDEHDVNF